MLSRVLNPSLEFWPHSLSLSCLHLNREVKGLSEHPGEKLEKGVGPSFRAGVVAAWGCVGAVPLCLTATPCEGMSFCPFSEGLSTSVPLGTFVPPGALPCRLGAGMKAYPLLEAFSRADLALAALLLFSCKA